MSYNIINKKNRSLYMSSDFNMKGKRRKDGDSFLMVCQFSNGSRSNKAERQENSFDAGIW